MCVPGRESVSNGLLADLVFRHGRNDFVVNEQSIDVERLGARGVGRLKLNSLSSLGIVDSGL